MAEHTPGPWEADCCDVTGARPPGDSGVRFWSVVGKGDYRGSVCNVHSAEHIGGITIAERDANARLIAAAPDLLEACYIGLGVALAFEEESDRSASEKIRAAIAKAKGQENA